jgi:hypothetical protein
VDYLILGVVALVIGGAIGWFVANRAQQGLPQAWTTELRQGQIYAIAVFVVVILAPGVIGLINGTWSGCRYPDMPSTLTPVPSPGPPAVVSQAVVPSPVPISQPPPNPALLVGLQSLLVKDLVEFRGHVLCLSRVNWGFDNWVKFVAVFAAFFTTLSSGVGWKQLGVASGAIATAMTGIQTVYPFSDRAGLNDRITARVDNVLSELTYSPLLTIPDDKLAVFINQQRSTFQTIKLDFAAGSSGQTSPSPTPFATPTATVAPVSPPATPGPNAAADSPRDAIAGAPDPDLLNPDPYKSRR